MLLRLRKLPVILLVLAVPLAVVAAKVVVACDSGTTTVSAQQSIRTGTFRLQFSSTTPGARVSPDGHTVICPTVTIMRSTDLVGADCKLDVKSTGSIPGSKITIKATLTSGGFALSRFTLDPKLAFASSASFHLDTVGNGRLIADIKNDKTGNQVTKDNRLDPTITWQGLTDSDLSGSLTMIYSAILTE